jgi:hypothetical protein
MQNYDVALIHTVKSSSYADALEYASDVAEGIGMEGENISAVLDYEEDSEGRRVIYLHKIDGTRKQKNLHSKVEQLIREDKVSRSTLLEIVARFGNDNDWFDE